jgi:hypothetical protein
VIFVTKHNQVALFLRGKIPTFEGVSQKNVAIFKKQVTRCINHIKALLPARTKWTTKKRIC